MHAEHHPARGSARLLLLVLLLAAGGVVAWQLAQRGPARRAGTRPAQELAYLNLGPEATYVGSEACKACHEDAHAGYAGTPHARSIQPVPADLAGVPGTFAHERSNIAFRFARDDAGVKVDAAFGLEGEEAEPLESRVLGMAVGSGEHLQCYLAEVDGFLVQAPVARDQDAWGMAPGYDRIVQGGFTRPVGRACLHCHAGRVENLDGSLHRIRFLETAIGCERCHGPGSVHVARHEAAGATGAEPTGEPDLTIVNPARLTRQGSLDVCTQCHLDEGLTVQRAGRNVLDWRPGLPLSDFRLTYRPRGPDGEVPDVGRLEQLAASRCFQQSPDMTCTTCHDAHGGPAPADRVAHYVAKCASCHGKDGCGLDLKARERSEYGNDCASCHMPRADEREHHGIYRHHRIAVHGTLGEPAVEVGEQLELVLREDVPDRSETEAERDRALALLRLPMWKPRGHPLPERGSLLAPDLIAAAVKEAQRVLGRLRAAGTLDPDAAVPLATLRARVQTEQSRTTLEAALRGEEPLREETRVYGSAILARTYFELAQFEQARTLLERLTALRRAHGDWEFMVEVANAVEDPLLKERAVEHVLQIAPHLLGSHHLAARVYRALGRPDVADHHARVATAMEVHLAARRNLEDRQRWEPPK